MVDLFQHSMMILALMAPVANASNPPLPDPNNRPANAAQVPLPDPNNRPPNAHGPELRPANRPPLQVIRNPVGPKILCCSRAKPPQPKSN
jgi:hypothetical protein